MESGDLATQRRLAASLTLPPEFAPVLVLALAVHLVTAAVGVERQTTGGLWLIGAGLAFFGLAALWLVQRFRSRNGAMVGGVISHAIFGSSPAGSCVYVAAFVATTWAAFAGVGWLVVPLALVGGLAYAVSALLWWRAYQQDPATHAHSEARLVMSLVAMVGAIGACMLIIYS